MLAEAFLYYNEEDLYEIDFAAEVQSEYQKKCIDAAVFFPQDEKRKIWKSIKKYTKINAHDSALCDWKLYGESNNTIDGLSFDGERLNNCLFGSPTGTIRKCTFSNILFTGCTFNFNYISDCSFLMCTFEDCIKEGKNHSCYEYFCTDNNNVLSLDDIEEIPDSDNLSDEDVKKIILQKYFKVGSLRRRMKLISVIRRDFIDNEKQFKRCLDSLSSEGLLIINGDKSFITNEGVQWINNE